MTETISNANAAASTLLLGHNGEWWDFWLIASVIAAALVATAIGVTTAGSIISHKRETAAAQRELASYKLTVDERVAEAKKEGIDAGKTAGDALLRAAALEKEAEELKAKNLELEAKVKARRLSGDDSVKLTAALSKLPHLPIGIVSRLLDPEGADFADDISGAFSNAQWQSVRQKDWTMSNKGVAIATFEGTSLPEDLKTALLDALGTANIKATITTIRPAEQNTTSAHFQPNALYLLVGAKPQ
jgi:hypothetical protein